ncbi:hypothetical protein GCM10007416_25860 [Kroppenstedtia guangzhouensis]|uniref:HTH cro/C1-type domain-containing protein n=1 Tax=Kroppenstedtia guangzhouensis TaxID=1274356 RepID=A0ABQ1GWX4_9BACL|nr:helix-turn-helix transcriptional regulator [Kroppenstedtia guangzhouensis]GGA51574.1 hypothetical protein GCM10007416_25860 [Kroppenstedtia guangzhouensis]
MENILRKRREKLWFREQNPAELGKWIREHRKEQGLRLEDLAGVGLSIATISNIERGIPRVRPEKFALLLEKLNLGEKDWQKRLSSSEREWEETLFTAEIFLRAGNPMEALRELERTGEKRGMKNSNYHLLKGECFFRMGNLIRAERCFLLAIRLSQRELLESEGNIEAAAYCGLGEIRGKEGEWKRALLLTETGLKKYDFRNGESYLLFNLWRNRAGCLLKLGRKWEALSTLKMVWKSVNRSPFSDGVLSLYILRARTHLGLNQYAEALQFAREGLNRAAAEGRVGKMYELAGVLAEATLMKGDRAGAQRYLRFLARMGDSVPAAERTQGWTLLGKYHTQCRKWREASNSFERARCFGNEAKRPDLLARVYLEWGDSEQARKNFTGAIIRYEEGLRVLADLGDPGLERVFRLQLARSWEGRDEKEFLRCLRKIYEFECGRGSEMKSDSFGDVPLPEENLLAR